MQIWIHEKPSVINHPKLDDYLITWLPIQSKGDTQGDTQGDTWNGCGFTFLEENKEEGLFFNQYIQLFERIWVQVTGAREGIGVLISQ